MELNCSAVPSIADAADLVIATVMSTSTPPAAPAATAVVVDDDSAGSASREDVVVVVGVLDGCWAVKDLIALVACDGGRYLVRRRWMFGADSSVALPRGR